MFSFSSFRELPPREVSLSLLSPACDRCTAALLSFLGTVRFVTDTIHSAWLDRLCQFPPTFKEAFHDGV